VFLGEEVLFDYQHEHYGTTPDWYQDQVEFSPSVRRTPAMKN